MDDIEQEQIQDIPVNQPLLSSKIYIALEKLKRVAGEIDESELVTQDVIELEVLRS